jgi:hypothetical protein
LRAEFVDPSKVCILSGRFPPTEFMSSWNHRAYANRHGYTYINCDWPTGADNRYMTKFHFVKEYVRHFDYVFWIDDDAFFVDLERSLAPLVPEKGKIASFCKSPTNKQIFTYLSSGQFLLEGGEVGAAFVDKILETRLEVVKDWWQDELGMFTNGDQDAIVYLVHEDPRYKDCLSLHHYSVFNSRLDDLQNNRSEVFLLHFTGPREKKLADHKQSMAILGTNASLIDHQAVSTLLSGRSEQKVLAEFPRVSVAPKRSFTGFKRIERALRKSLKKPKKPS